MGKFRHALVIGFSLACLLSATQAHQALDEEAEAATTDQLLIPDELIQDEVPVTATKATTTDVDSAAYAKLDALAATPSTSFFQGKDFNFYYEKYPYEVYCMGVFIGLIFMCIIGKSSNRDLAQKWHKKTLPLLKDNFAYVGIADGQTNLDFE